MKKFLLLVATLCSMNLFAQKQGEDNGFGLKIFAGFGGEKFGLSDDNISALDNAKSGLEAIGLDPDDYFKKVTSVGLSLDNRWYVGNPGILGIAVNARWFDISYGKKEYKQLLGISTIDIKDQFLDFGVLGLGPLFTFYLNDKLAIDLYYNAQPSVMVCFDKASATINTGNWGNGLEIFEVEQEEGDEEQLISCAFGAAHFVGAAFRFKMFQIGAEYKFAQLPGNSWGDIDLKNHKIRNNQMRVFLGFKF